MSQKIEKTDSIKVVDEAGNPLTINVLTKFTLFKPLSGPSEWVPGSKRYWLNGEHCNVIDTDTWETLMSKKILRRA